MRGVIRALSCAFLLAALRALAAEPSYPAAVNRFDDQAGLNSKAKSVLQIDDLVRRLEAFEKQSGIRIVVQFHAKSPPEAEDKVAGAYMSALSTQLGLIDHGILVVYFADDPDWRIWFGNAIAPVFVGRPDKGYKELTADGSIHNAKEAFIEACGLDADEALKQRELTGGSKPAPNDHAIVEGTLIAEGLMKRLGPKP